jgi:translation initiation factor IF-2
MSIRLSKACKDLNVGMTTAVEFLAKKGHKIVVDPNLKLSDDLYLLLAKEFDKDMALKLESERLSQERHLKEKAATVAIEGYEKTKPVEKQTETIHITIPEDQLPHFKPVGHIDLNAKVKQPSAKPVEKPIIPPVVEKLKPESENKEVEQSEEVDPTHVSVT